MPPLVEQKNGVCASCERGEIAFSFHFTRLPFPSRCNPNPLPLAPITHILGNTHTAALIPSAVVLWLSGGTQHGFVSVLELHLLISGGRCSGEQNGRPPVASQQGTTTAMYVGQCTDVWPHVGRCKYTPAGWYRSLKSNHVL